MRHKSSILFLLVALLVLQGCDSVQPSDSGSLVVEAYFDAGKPLPPIRVGRSVPVGTNLSNADFVVADAQVELTLDGATISYMPAPDHPGTYVAPSEAAVLVVPPGAGFQLRVIRGDVTMTANGTVPPVVRLSDVWLDIPDRAVQAVFVDTLNIGLDSLNLGIEARSGYIFPIQVSMEWEPAADAQVSRYWVETRLDPVTPFSSSIIDFFLLPIQITQESRTSTTEAGNRTWTGVYAVPVDGADDPVPEHDLRITLLRGDDRFARFTTSKGDPPRREPVTNLDHALGFIGGISVDSLRVHIGSNR